MRSLNDTGGSITDVTRSDIISYFDVGRVGGYPPNYTFTVDNVQSYLAILNQQLRQANLQIAAALKAYPNTQSAEWGKAALLSSRINKQIKQLESSTLPVSTDANGFLQVLSLSPTRIAAVVSPSLSQFSQSTIPATSSLPTSITSRAPRIASPAADNRTLLLLAAGAVVVFLILQ